jgi:hypothetical protein
MPSNGWLTLGASDVLGHLRADLRRATSSAWVIGPWIDAFFAQILVEALPTKAALRVVTRPQSDGNSNFNEHAIAACICLKERPNTVVRLLANLHAKLLVVDERIVYCGSADWYRYSLQESCEIVLRGPGASVTGLLDQIQVIWDQASEDEPVHKRPGNQAIAARYLTEVTDPVAEVKLREVPGSFIVRRPLRSSDPTDDLTSFKNRVLDDLLPKFCDDPSRGWGSAGFKQPDWSNVSKVDAKDFLRALDANLVEHVGRGQYLAPRSGAKEQFFSSGSTHVTPRPFSLWMEPIITVAGLARLHFEYGWPSECLGMQPRGYAFDLVAYNRLDRVNEHVACEVKKSTRELDQLVRLMQQFAANNVQSDASISGPEKNAFPKLKALRDRKVPVFWALGPGGASYVFRMVYGEGGLVTFNPASEHDLRFREA